jgi:hypothetical protein
MSDNEFNKLLDEFDINSNYFHNDTCSAMFVDSTYCDTKTGKRKFNITDRINYSDINCDFTFNLGDATYIFDTFLEFGDEAIDFFNKYIEKRGLKLVKTETNQ